MTTTDSPQRTFRAHVEKTAQTAQPVMHSGFHESVAEFLAMTEGHYADGERQVEKFEPSRGNAWLTAEHAAAIAYRSTPNGSESEYPFTLAVYVEGDVTRYRFQRFEDAARAGRLWAAGDPAKSEDRAAGRP